MTAAQAARRYDLTSATHARHYESCEMCRVYTASQIDSYRNSHPVCAEGRRLHGLRGDAHTAWLSARGML